MNNFQQNALYLSIDKEFYYNNMKKFILDLIVKKNVQLNFNYVLLILTSSEKLPDILPGQFVEIRVDGSPTTFLRRPISVHFVDYDKNELWLLIQIVGDGSKRLSELQSNDILNVMLPLGNGFTLPKEKDKNLFLIGGGCGVAPLLYMGAYLKSLGYKCNFLLGARTKADLLQLEEFEKYGNVYTTTEDGSHGECGFVVHHSILKEKKIDKVYTCGPTPMMKAVAAFAKESGSNCEVSLENTMACGIGACLCCVTNTVEGHVCVCTEGPVFNITDLKW